MQADLTGVISHLSIMQSNTPLGACGDIAGVSDDHDGASIAMKLLKQSQDLLARLAVQCAGRFVSQDERWIIDDGAGNDHPLLFSAGQLIGPMVGTVTQPHSLERALGSTPSLTSMNACIA